MKNNDFQIAFCETNLRWLAGDPPSEERAQKVRAMVREIERLNDTYQEEEPMMRT